MLPQRPLLLLLGLQQLPLLRLQERPGQGLRLWRKRLPVAPGLSKQLEEALR